MHAISGSFTWKLIYWSHTAAKSIIQLFRGSAAFKSSFSLSVFRYPILSVSVHRLFFSVLTVASPVEKEGCHNGVCITPEITAEVGLCVVIPCHFTNDPGFTLESAVLYKCDPSNENCTDSDKILHLNNTKLNAQSGSRGRVSFFYESLNNCSVIINDITEADAGSYQLRVNSFLNGTTKEHTSPRANVTVKGMKFVCKLLYAKL